MPISENKMYSVIGKRKYARMEKILYVWFWITSKNISNNYAFCVMKLNGLKEGMLI